jgi:hypothetical protein
MMQRSNSMEHVTAIARIQAQPPSAAANGTLPHNPTVGAAQGGPVDVTPLVERFDAMMQRSGGAAGAAQAAPSDIALTRIVGGAAEAELQRTAALDQASAQPMSKLETMQHVAQMSVQGSFMALRLQAFAQMSNRTREGVQTLVKNQ